MDIFIFSVPKYSTIQHIVIANVIIYFNLQPNQLLLFMKLENNPYGMQKIKCRLFWGMEYLPGSGCFNFVLHCLLINNLVTLQLLAKDPALERFKSYRKSASRIRSIGDYLTIAVVAGCCYEIYVRAVTREEARKAKQQPQKVVDADCLSLYA